MTTRSDRDEHTEGGRHANVVTCGKLVAPPILSKHTPGLLATPCSASLHLKRQHTQEHPRGTRTARRTQREGLMESPTVKRGARTWRSIVPLVGANAHGWQRGGVVAQRRRRKRPWGRVPPRSDPLFRGRGAVARVTPEPARRGLAGRRPCRAPLPHEAVSGGPAAQVPAPVRVDCAVPALHQPLALHAAAQHTTKGGAASEVNARSIDLGGSLWRGLTSGHSETSQRCNCGRGPT
jgi:hypothetical protein